MPKGEYLQYGGQAVVDGVMMRSPHYFSVACRAPDGRIVVHSEPLAKTWIGRQKWLKWPFFRGSLALLDTMALGMRAFRYAAAVHLDPRFAKDKVAEAASPPKSAKTLNDITIGATMVTSLAIGLFIFNYLPNLIAESLNRVDASWVITNLVTEVIKITIFLGYIWLIGRLPDIQEVFKYHGAEHKSINALEAGQELNMQNALAQTRLHPRCGTSFAIVVLIVSLVVFTFVPRYPLGDVSYLFNVTVRFGIELLILPFISGIAYEIIRFAGNMRNSSLVQGLLWPGLMSQYLTTREPEAHHTEVALSALRAVMDAESGKVPLTEAREEVIESASPESASHGLPAQTHP